MKDGLPGGTLRVFTRERLRRRPVFMMVRAGLDLSRMRLDFCLLDARGDHVEVGTTPPDADGLRALVRGVAERHGPC
jgi:hypothetical protein